MSPGDFQVGRLGRSGVVLLRVGSTGLGRRGIQGVKAVALLRPGAATSLLPTLQLLRPSFRGKDSGMPLCARLLSQLGTEKDRPGEHLQKVLPNRGALGAAQSALSQSKT